MAKLYNQVYGKYSTASGVWLDEKSYKNSKQNIFTEDIIETYITKVLQDLLRMNIETKIQKMSVMDIGSGRHSLAFEKLGAKKIDLIDISKSNFYRMRKFKKENRTIVRNFNYDICSLNFHKWKRKYDLIYLDGVIQHTKLPSKALYNLRNKLKKNGILYLYFYQFGNPLNIYRDIARQIFSKKKLTIKETITFFKKKYKPKVLDSIIDNLGCDYCHILPSKYYMNLMKSLGFKIFWSKDIYNRKPSIRISRRSCLSSFKVKNKINKINYKKLLDISKYNIYDYKNYHKEDKELIIKINKKKNDLLKLIEKNLSKSSIFKILDLFIAEILKEKLIDSYLKKSANLEKKFNRAILIAK